jgi:hypothetical protein
MSIRFLDVRHLRKRTHAWAHPGRRFPATMLLLLGGVGGLLGACTPSHTNSGERGAPEPAHETTCLLNVRSVRFLEGRRYSGDRFPGPSTECPLLEHFNDFFQMDWSTDLELSEFDKPTQPGQGGYFTVCFEGSRIRRIEQHNEEDPDYPGVVVSSVYEIDEAGRLSHITHAFRRQARGREGEEPLVWTVRIEYQGDTRAPKRLVVSGNPDYPPVFGGGGDPYYIHYECESVGSGYWRVVAREARTESGKPIARLGRGEAAREELHYYGPEPEWLVKYSELFDEDGKPVMRNGKPVRVNWYVETEGGYRYLGARGQYVDPDGNPFEDEE